MTNLVPQWTLQDEQNLRARIDRLRDHPAPLKPAGVLIHAETTCQLGCADGDHHAAARIGPYLICRCLLCSELVVGLPSEV